MPDPALRPPEPSADRGGEPGSALDMQTSTTTPARPPHPPTRGRGFARLLVTPALLIVVLVVLWRWVSAATKDAIAQRSLGAQYVWERVYQQVELVAVSTVLVLVIAIPLGIILSRRGARWLTPFFLTLANIGQGAPAIGVIVLLAVIFGTSYWVAIAALVAYSVLPALRNTLVGLEQVDPALVEAGRGIGMSAVAVLVRVELPLAVPVIMAGIRTTLVLNTGVATLAAFIGAGGLGNLITAGIENQRDVVLMVGSVLVAVLALFIDWLASIAERYLRPAGT